jgi:hypothetical protein
MSVRPNPKTITDRIRRAARESGPPAPQEISQILDEPTTIDYTVKNGISVPVGFTKMEVPLESRDDSIYYNIQMNNTNATSQIASFQQNLPTNIIDNVDDYYMTVCRFVLDLVDIPLFVFRPNVYWVTLSYMGSDYSQPVLYTLPNPSGGPQNVYSYQSFIQLINIAIVAAYQAMLIDYPALPNLTFPTAPIWLVYNPDNGVTSVYGLASLCDFSLTNPITIWFSTGLNYFFDNFYSNYLSQGASDHKDVQIIITNLYNTNSTPITYVVSGGGTTSDMQIQMKQEYQATYRWSDISLIVFKTYSLGTRPEYAQNPNLTSNLVSNTQAGVAIPTSQILTDFAIDPVLPGDSQSLAVYTPAIYRLIDILGAKTNSIDISIYWRDKIGDEYPITIPPNGSITVKLGFFKKSLFKNFLKSNQADQNT